MIAKETEIVLARGDIDLLSQIHSMGFVKFLLNCQVAERLLGESGQG